ncbi:hypothetical protein J2W42_003532 [Rhizobium tibeticum]|nr:hypothetical protein [Rhizobium tibeticum]MDP9810669.1 hypothetical protein [Rhizobium tibeticum]
MENQLEASIMGWRSIDRAQVDRLVAAIRQAPVGGVPVGYEQAADGWCPG